MEGTNGYRFKSSQASSTTPLDSRKYQEQQICSLKEKFPGLDDGTLEDILAAVEWDVNKAAEMLRDDAGSFGDIGMDDVYIPAPTPSLDGVNLFHEITQSQQSQKAKDRPKESKSNQSSRPPSRLYEDEVQQAVDQQVFPALPSSSANWNFNQSVRHQPAASSCDFSVPNCSAAKAGASYSPPKKPMTVYNALQDSSPYFRVHKSPWNTDFSKGQLAEENDDIISHVVEEPSYEPDRDYCDDTEVIHDDDVYTNTDGDDWFSLQLEPGFVYQLFSKYSNPFGAMDVGRLLVNDLNIRIPPKLAFELFRHLCLSLLQKMPEESTGSSSPSDSFDDEGIDHFVATDVGDKMKPPENSFCHDGPTPDLRRIMELEMQLEGEEANRVKNLRSKLQSNLATKLTIEHLQSAFPSIPRSTIEAYFVANNFRYDETVEKLQLEFSTAFVNHINNNQTEEDAFQEAMRSDLEVLNDSAKNQTSRHFDGQTATDLRRTAQTHYFLMREYAQKRKECSHAPGIAEYYSKMGRLHYESMQEANRLASRKIFEENNGAGKPPNQIDLHHLTVQEALQRLQSFMNGRENALKNSGRESMELKIVCGRGKHSDVHGPKLGPAIIRYLHKRGFNFQEPLNGGYIYVLLRNKNLAPNFKPRK